MSPKVGELIEDQMYTTKRYHDGELVELYRYGGQAPHDAWWYLITWREATGWTCFKGGTKHTWRKYRSLDFVHKLVDETTTNLRYRDDILVEVEHRGALVEFVGPGDSHVEYDVWWYKRQYQKAAASWTRSWDGNEHTWRKYDSLHCLPLRAQYEVLRDRLSLIHI